MGRGWVIALCAIACGASQSARSTTVRVDPGEFLLEVGGQSASVLTRPERSIEELETARRDARGNERRAISRELVIAHMFAAEQAEGRDARRIRRRAEQLADSTVQGSRDDALLAEMAFVKLWMSWRAGTANAAQRAERFTDRYRQSGDLLTLAWMIRGEIALDGEDYDDALTAFRFALGQLEHPLYAYALFRSARAYRVQGRTEEADQALAEVESLGCASALPSTIRLANAAAGERGTGVARGADGVERPASCPAPGTNDDEEEGWRPAE
jgi:tetratricopeptide (TPR) repeat protein